ncbi:hypothetical protein [Streptomyces sp. NPDC051636]|uniref:hypothetical protein n=1 Tax=Streptomyces sp. NPDC051636 TaxID=3365663 RepID=UPI0037903D90
MRRLLHREQRQAQRDRAPGERIQTPTPAAGSPHSDDPAAEQQRHTQHGTTPQPVRAA